MAVNAYDRASYSQLKLPTFQEMMIAPQYLTEQHEMAQARADELLSEAQKVELAAMENPNGKAAQLYQGYTQRLNEAVNSLNERGINASNIKANLGKLKADYNAQIAPIAQAWEQQRKDKEAYNAMTAKDRSLITAYDPSQTSIDAYLGRNNASYIPQGISGNEIAQRVAMAAKPYSDWISQKLPEISKTGLPYKYFTMVQKGFSPDDVAAAMRDDGIDAQTASEGALMLKDLRDNVIASSGAYELFGNNPEAINRLIQYANTGLSQAIGTKQFGTLSDTFNEDMAKTAAKQRAARQALQMPSAYPYATPIEKISFNEKQMKDVLAVKDLINKHGIPKEVTKFEDLPESYKKLYTERGSDVRIDASGQTSPFRTSEQFLINSYNRGAKKYKELANNLGLDPDLEGDKLISILNNMKNNAITLDKMYYLDPVANKYSVERLNSVAAHSAREGNFFVNPEGKPTDDWFYREAYDEKTKELKPGFRWETRNNRLGIYNANKQRFYPANLDQYDANLVADLKTREDYALQQSEYLVNRLNQIDPETFYEAYGITKEDYLQKALDQINARLSQESQESIQSNTSIRNEKLSLKPNTKEPIDPNLIQ